MKIIKSFIITVIFLITTGCASLKPSSDADRIEVEPHQERFALLSNGKVTVEQVKRIPIHIIEYEEGTRTVGVCYWFGPFSYITLNKKWWFANRNVRDREQLVFHEIAHCLLGRPHTMPADTANFISWMESLFFDLEIFEKIPGYLRDMCPSSYMHPTLISSKCVNRHYDYYIEELFGRIKAEEYIYVYGY